MTRVAAFLRWLATPIRAADARCVAIARGLRDAAGLRAAAMVLMAGAGMAWTLIAMALAWMLRGDPRALLWLAMGALLIVFTVVTGYGALLYKRSFAIHLPGGGTIELRDETHAAEVVAAVTQTGQEGGQG